MAQQTRTALASSLAIPALIAPGTGGRVRKGRVVPLTSFIPTTQGSPVLSNVTQSPVTRWQSIHFEFQAPQGYQVEIVAQIGSDSSLWMVVYDESLATVNNNNPLAPLFSYRTSIVINGLNPRSFVCDILPNGGWQRPNVNIVPFICIEAH